jgi:hypothetical protein
MVQCETWRRKNPAVGFYLLTFPSSASRQVENSRLALFPEQPRRCRPMTRRVASLIMSVCVAFAMWTTLAVASLLMWKFLRDYSG